MARPSVPREGEKKRIARSGERRGGSDGGCESSADHQAGHEQRPRATRMNLVNPAGHRVQSARAALFDKEAPRLSMGAWGN